MLDTSSSDSITARDRRTGFRRWWPLAREGGLRPLRTRAAPPNQCFQKPGPFARARGAPGLSPLQAAIESNPKEEGSDRKARKSVHTSPSCFGSGRRVVLLVPPHHGIRSASSGPRITVPLYSRPVMIPFRAPSMGILFSCPVVFTKSVRPSTILPYTPSGVSGPG